MLVEDLCGEGVGEKVVDIKGTWSDYKKCVDYFQSAFHMKDIQVPDFKQ